MNRFIRIEEKNFNKSEVVAYYIDKCNNCPLMVYSKTGFYCKCRIFKDNNFNNIIKSFVINLHDDILTDVVDIPHWCGLPNSVETLVNSRRVFMIKDDVIITPYRNDLSRVPIINNTFEYNKVKYENNNDYDAFQKIINTSFEPMGEDDRLVESKPIIFDKRLICSSCLEKKESVIRNKHNGMCDECYDKSYNNLDECKKAFINNFRLKRNISVLNKDIKLV